MVFWNTQVCRLDLRHLEVNQKIDFARRFHWAFAQSSVLLVLL